MSKYKLTMKFWDENDQVVYLRIPASANWFLCTTAGQVDTKMVDELFKVVKKQKLPAEAMPVFVMPSKPGEPK